MRAGLVAPSASSAGLPGARSAPDGRRRPPTCCRHAGGAPSTAGHDRASGNSAQKLRAGVLADERGLALVELLAALVVGAIVLFATFGLLDTAVRLQAKAVDGIEAVDRGRLGIDQITQVLASRICLGTQPSLVEGSDSRIELYASLAPESGTVRLVAQRRRLTFFGDAIREELWVSSPPAAPPAVPPASTTTPTSTRTLATDVRPIASTPVFRYYANEGTPAHPTLRLPTPLSASDRARVAMIDVGFVARGRRADVVTTFGSQIFNRSSTCVE